MTLEEFFKLLGITKNAEAIRLLDGVVPSVDFVDLGANGYGETGFMVKKGRPMTLDKMTYDAKAGKWVVTAKGAEPDSLKLSAAHKAAITEAIAAQKAQIDTLEKMVVDAVEDESAKDLPEELKAVLAGTTKAADEPKTESEPTTEEPKAEPAQAFDGFEVGGLVITGGLADIAKRMAEDAGEQMKDEEFASAFAQKFAPLVEMQSKLDSGAAASQAVASVSKRMNSELAEMRKQMEKQQDAMTALASSLFGAGVIQDGVPQPAPTTVQKSTKPALPCNQDLNLYRGDSGMADYGFHQ